MGVMTVARHGEQFSHAERDVFLIWSGQVSSSIENIALHELVSEQAVTDELTGLSNNRRFRELISKEAARAQRFGHELSLLMLDLDDFKRVNDTLRAPAGRRGAAKDRRGACVRVARHGRAGALWRRGVRGGAPGDGARGRSGARGAHSRPHRVGGDPAASKARRALRITASVGAASIPESADTARTLIAAADAALYEAKRSGKNRVSGAPEKSAAGRS